MLESVDRRVRWALGTSVGVLALAVLGTAAVFPRLPATVAIHFTAGGQPNTVVPRAVGVAAVPAIAVGTLALLGVLAGRSDTRSGDGDAHGEVLAVTVVATTGLLVALHGLVLAWNLGYPVPFEWVLVGSLCWATLLGGYAVWRDPPDW